MLADSIAPVTTTAAQSDPSLGFGTGLIIGIAIGVYTVWVLFHRRVSMDCPDCGASHVEGCNNCTKCGTELERNEDDRRIDQIARFNAGDSR